MTDRKFNRISKEDWVMSILYRAVIAVACLFAAIACYAYGVPAGGGVFLLIGIAFEGMFWIGLFGRKQLK